MKISLPAQAFPMIFVVFEMGIPFLAYAVVYFFLYILLGLYRLISLRKFLVVPAVLIIVRTIYLQVFDLFPTPHMLPIVITTKIENVWNGILVGGHPYKGYPIIFGHERSVFFFSLGWNLVAAVTIFLLTKYYCTRLNRLM